MKYKPEAAKWVYETMLTAAPEVQMEVVGWQFYEDGKWWSGDDRIKDHKKNTQEAGYLIRDVYAATAVQEECLGVGKCIDQGCPAHYAATPAEHWENKGQGGEV